METTTKVTALNSFFEWLAKTGGTVLEIEKYLKELGVDHTAVDSDGWNLLQLAVQKGGNIEVVKYLKELGVDHTTVVSNDCAQDDMV